MRSNRMSIGRWDIIEFCKALLQMPHYKYPDLSFDFEMGAVKYNAVIPKTRKIVGDLFTYSGMQGLCEFETHLVSLFRGMGEDFSAYAKVLQSISQDFENIGKKISLTCPPETGLAGQTLVWEITEQSTRGAVDLALRMMKLAKIYSSLAREIPLVIALFRRKGVEKLFFIAWEFLALGFSSDFGQDFSKRVGLRSVNRFVCLDDYEFEGSFPLAKLLESSFKIYLAKLEAVNATYRQSRFPRGVKKKKKTFFQGSLARSKIGDALKPGLGILDSLQWDLNSGNFLFIGNNGF